MISKNRNGVYYPGKFDEQKSVLQSSVVINDLQNAKGPVMAVPGRYRSKESED
jgi:hypothetical protein